MCLFCLLETTSVNEFMKRFPKYEYWHFKISWKHCLQDFDISTRSYLTSCRDSRRDFGRLDFEISLRSYLKFCRDSRRVFGRRDFEISPRRVLGENLDEILRSRRESRSKSCRGSFLRFNLEIKTFIFPFSFFVLYWEVLRQNDSLQNVDGNP